MVGGGARRAVAGCDWPGAFQGVAARGVAAGGAGGGGSHGWLSVHLRADAWVFEAAPAAFPVAMSRFKVSKFRHMEARPSRREVSPARRTRAPAPPPPQTRAGTPEPSCPGAPPSGLGPASGLFRRTRRAESGAARPGLYLSPLERPAVRQLPRLALGPPTGVTSPTRRRPEACEAACLLRFRSASLGSRGRALLAPAPPCRPDRPCPGLGCGRMPLSPLASASPGVSAEEQEPLRQRRAPPSGFRRRFLLLWLAQEQLFSYWGDAARGWVGSGEAQGGGAQRKS